MYSSEGLQDVFLFFLFTVATAQVTAAEPSTLTLKRCCKRSSLGQHTGLSPYIPSCEVLNRKLVLDSRSDTAPDKQSWTRRTRCRLRCCAPCSVVVFVVYRARGGGYLRLYPLAPCIYHTPSHLQCEQHTNITPATQVP